MKILSHKAVFVYEDRKVGLMVLPGPPMPSWRFIVRPPLTLSFKECEVTFRPPEYTEYFNRGRMFDGRPIYCAKDIQLAYAGAQGFVALAQQDLLDDLNRREVRRLCKRKYGPTYIELDERYGDGRQNLISPEMMKAQCLTYREARLVIAV